jgi:cell division protein FtsL
MTPGTAAAHRSRKLRRSPAARAPRRVSGPTRPPRAALAGAGAGTAVARPPLSLRLGRRAMRVGDARVLDRLVRGRAWIAIVAAALIGIVFMQVSMLKLNAGVSRAVTAADTLERQNSSLRADISKLDSGERVQDAAANLGMTTRPAGDVRYLDAERASAARAAAAA